MAYQVVKKKHLRGDSSKFYPYRILIGLLVVRGRRAAATKMVGRLFLHIRKKYKVHPILFFEAFFEKLRPKVGLYGKKIAGITHKIPVPISYRKSVSILLHWWIQITKKNLRGRKFFRVLVHEMDNAYRLTSSPIAKKRDEVHRLSHFNRPFLRYLRF